MLKLNDQDYLNIPILANVYVAPGLALKAGIQPAFNVSSKVSVDGVTVITINMHQRKHSSLLTSLVPVGLSYEYMNVCLDARYNIGVTKVLHDSDDAGCNSVFQITLGYKFAL